MLTCQVCSHKTSLFHNLNHLRNGLGRGIDRCARTRSSLASTSGKHAGDGGEERVDGLAKSGGLLHGDDVTDILEEGRHLRKVVDCGVLDIFSFELWGVSNLQITVIESVLSSSGRTAGVTSGASGVSGRST